MGSHKGKHTGYSRVAMHRIDVAPCAMIHYNSRVFGNHPQIVTIDEIKGLARAMGQSKLPLAQALNAGNLGIALEKLSGWMVHETWGFTLW